MSFDWDSLFSGFYHFGILTAFFMTLLFPVVLPFIPLIVFFAVLWHITLSNGRSAYLSVVRSVCRIE